MKEVKKILLSLSAIAIGGGLLTLLLSRGKADYQPKSLLPTKNSSQTKSKTNQEEPKKNCQTQILACLETWKSRDSEASLLIQETINLLTNSRYSPQQKIKALESLLTSYQETEPEQPDQKEKPDKDTIYFPSAEEVKLSANYCQLEKLAQEWKAHEQKQVQNEKSHWFASQHWLTDREIDWALELVQSQRLLGRMVQQPLSHQNNKFKILPAYQFMYVLESQGEGLGFPELLSQLSDESVELVFLPVNNPDFHWSLLVYETSTKKFTHFDTLRGANDAYVKPLIKDLVLQLWQINENDFNALEEKAYWLPRYEIKQGNTWDCGVAVIEITQRIMEKWRTFARNRQFSLSGPLGKFDFARRRKEWKEKVEAGLDE
ncbi:MAG: sentrin/sumo-specific protease [Mycoplasmataceae bacterium CE_OT135]|nr:MAG: sentrin/sumo-specific protease [Mycoplasmataceae bacterium CE_OT135]